MAVVHVNTIAPPKAGKCSVSLAALWQQRLHSLAAARAWQFCRVDTVESPEQCFVPGQAFLGRHQHLAALLAALALMHNRLLQLLPSHMFWCFAGLVGHGFGQGYAANMLAHMSEPRIVCCTQLDEASVAASEDGGSSVGPSDQPSSAKVGAL